MNDKNGFNQLRYLYQGGHYYMEPDHIIDYGKEGAFAAELKPILYTRQTKVDVSDLEQRTKRRLNSLYSRCRFYLTENSSDKIAIVKYDGGNKEVLFKKNQAIVCWECFNNPLGIIKGDDLFEKMKKDGTVLWDEFKEQVRTATIEINRKLRKTFSLKEDVLFYSSIPQIIINPTFLY